MPTPFVHLQIAERLQAHSALEGWARRLIEDEWPAFYLGSVAADVNMVSPISRAESHFYPIPPAAEDRGYPAMLACHPELVEASSLPPAQAVFLAAYCAHLSADLSWSRAIVPRYFHLTADRSRRRLAFHILLTILDKIAFDSLPPTAGQTLAAARPRGWLPFAPDRALIHWRDMLAGQLQPGGVLLTVPIFARRLEMTPEAFAALLDDKQWLAEHVFSLTPLDDVEQLLSAITGECAAVIMNYLSGDIR